MKKNEKEAFVDDMKGRLEKAQATFVVDYQGLDVEALNKLRGELRKVDAEFRVVKNRLLKLASQDTETGAMKEHFVGPCALAISYEDMVAPARVLVNQSKDMKNLEIKAGQISGKVIDLEGVKRLAQLPSREVLLSQVLNAMQGVTTSFVRVLNGTAVKLLNVLKAIEEQKSEN